MANYNGHEGDIKVAEEAGLGLNMFVLMVGVCFSLAVEALYNLDTKSDF